MQKTAVFFIFLLFLGAFFLRVLFLPQNALTFGYDQARDAYISREILNGDWKILGPPASTPGLYHGVFYYYLLAPAYWIGKGSPIIAAYWITLLNSMAVFIVFGLAYLMTRKVMTGLLSTLVFAVSFEASQYAVWLSNPTIGVWTVPLGYLGLWLWLKEKNQFGPLIAAVGLGLSIQAEIFLAYHIVPMTLLLLLGRKSIKFSHLIQFAVVLTLVLSTMILSELKFGFRGLSGLAQLATAQDALVASKGLGDFLVLYFNQLGKVFAYTVYPGNVGYGGIFVLALLMFTLLSWDKKELSWKPFLAAWLFSHIAVVSVGGTSTPFLLVGIGPGVAVLVGIYLGQWWKTRVVVAAVVLAVIITGNIAMLTRENPKGQTIFAIQKDMLLKKQLAAIDYTYKEAEGRPFSINSLTSPLWINIVWAYLYDWYGTTKYGYVPEWHGRDQIGQLAALPSTKSTTTQYFLILEPMGGIPQRYLPETIAEEDGVSTLLGEQSFGELRIQKRARIQRSQD